MKSCPCCGSGKIKEYRVNGIWALVCYACGYDSAAKDRRVYEQKLKKDKEKERER